VNYVPGVMDVFVIESGPHAGDLIYMQRQDPTEPGLGHPYPWVHARADGTPIRVLAEEPLRLVGIPHPDAPKLKAYLQRIGGTIIINGRPFP